MKPEQIQGFTLQALQPIALTLALEFMFETDGVFYLLLACFVLWGIYLFYKAYATEGKAKYEPLVAEMRESIEAGKTNYASLEGKFTEFVEYAEKELQFRAESIASLLENAKVKEGEAHQLSQKIHLLESGEELRKAQWEVTRLEQALTQQKQSYERQLTQAQEKLTQAGRESEGKLLEMHNKLTQAQRDNKTLQEEVTRLLPYETQARELFKESEGRRLKQSFAQALNGSGNDKILEVSKSLEELGISPMELCTTPEKKKRYQEALDAQSVVV